jgi:putative ABC transport system permease protein
MRIEVDAASLGFGLAASLVAALLSSLAAAMLVARADLGPLLKDNARTTTGGGARLRSALVVSQVCLTLLLLMGAGLLTRTFLRLRNQETGFRTESLLVVRATNYRTGTRAEKAAALSRFHEQVLERLRALPGVVSAGGTNGLPYTRTVADRGLSPLRIKGASAQETRLQLPLSGADVSPGYLETMGIAVTQGRTFDVRDTQAAPMVVIVNERAAKALWPGRDPIGQEVYWGSDEPSDENPYCRVVGVVGNVRHLAGEADSGLEFYYPYTQYPITNIYYVVRTRGDPASLAATVRQTVASVDRNAAIVFVKTMEAVIDESLWQRRLWSVLLAGFGLLSLNLVAVGLYGLLSYLVGQQTREIGVRMALGAEPRRILGLVLGHGARLLAAGLALGLVAGLALKRVLGSFVFGVSATDPGNLAISSAVLAVVAMLACYLPARRASAVDPIRALRDS